MNVKAPTAWLGGLSPAQFMRRHWQRAPLLVRGAWPQAQPPVSRSELFALAARDDVESRLVRCDEHGRWHLRRGPLPRRALPALAAPRWTLLVQGLDLHADAAHVLLQPFRFVPDARLDDLMLSYASDGGGVGPHIDAYDVFLLQVAGRRRWRWGRVAKPAWRDDVPLKMLARFEPEHDAVLAPGDLLYLPPGWGHHGVAVGNDCMTASVGFRSPSAGELGRALVARLAEDGAGSEGRRYRDAPRAATTQAGRVPEGLQVFARAAVADLVTAPGALERALGEWITEPKPEVWFDRAPRPHRLVAGVRLDRRTRMAFDTSQVFVNGESWRAAGADAQLLQSLADARGLDAAAVRGASRAAKGLLADWIEAGWLRLDNARSDDASL
jgi:50S ribosomal protein L16 3-hydroxylase